MTYTYTELSIRIAKRRCDRRSDLMALDLVPLTDDLESIWGYVLSRWASITPRSLPLTRDSVTPLGGGAMRFAFRCGWEAL